MEPSRFWGILYKQVEPTGDERADLTAAFAPLVSPGDFLGSTSVPLGTTVGGVNQPQALIGGREGAPSLEHPFTRALHSKGMTITEWAENHGLDRGTVKFWYIAGGRKIPRKWADVIAKELGVPATARTWKNGIREGK